MTSLLTIDNYSCGFGNKKVLDAISLEIENSAINQLMGPSGTGKSTLFYVLAGLTDKIKRFYSTGKIIYCGEKLGRLSHPVLLEQKPSIMHDTVVDVVANNCSQREQIPRVKQRKVATDFINSYQYGRLLDKEQPLTSMSLLERRIAIILSIVIKKPKLLLLDEPTTNLERQDAFLMLNFIKTLSDDLSVFVVQHNQEYAKYLGGSLFLLAGGKIQEQQFAEDFFNAPLSEAGREFVQTGSCAVPGPNANYDDLDPEYINRYVPVKSKIQQKKVITYGTQGFKWVEKEMIGVTPRPGLLNDLVTDLTALKKVNIKTLICLEENTINKVVAKAMGVEIRHFPIKDMKVPGIQQIKKIIATIKQLKDNKQPVAIHCKAGLGRTGTIVACYFISLGFTAEDAIFKTRLLDSRMIQSREQELFVGSLNKKTFN